MSAGGFVAEGKGLTWTVDTLDQLTQAEVYGRVLTRLAGEHPDIVVCCADLLKSTKLREFERAYPHRVFNFGVSEQNMMSAAAGMSLEGLHPFVSTFGAFASMRACEQVRTDVVYQRTRVKIIATHSGLSFGQAGTTHHCTEDLAIMRSFAGMTVLVPADALETGKAIEALAGHPGPAYVRLGRGFEFPAYENDRFEFTIGRANMLRDGGALTIIACGVGVEAAKEAAETLAFDEGIDIRVLDMHTVKPLDRDAVIRAARETRRILTVEEHNVIGGLGSAVAEVLAEEGLGARFKRLGIPDTFCEIGYPEDLYKLYGIDCDGIARAARELLRR